jgi:hypothetical protein
VVDTFYVKDMFGLKLHTRSRQESLERKLRDAIARVAERAGAARQMLAELRAGEGYMNMPWRPKD